MTTAGKMRERVRFERRGLDPNGDRLGDYDAATGITRAAEIFFRKGSEPVLQARLQGVQPAEITVRADSETRTVTSAWRVVDTRTGAIFAILTDAPAQGRDYITFFCQIDGSDGGP